MTARNLPEDEVRRRLASGESRAKIAREYGISPSSLSHWCKLRGISPMRGNLPRSERQAMPADLDVRTLDEYPGYLFGADGHVYSATTDPPLRLAFRQVGTADQARYRLKIGNHTVNPARLICEAWHGPPASGQVCARRDGNSLNLAPDNLYWAESRVVISDRDFVVAYMRGTSLSEIADMLGMTAPNVSVRARSLINRGVRLPDRRSFSTADELNDLIDGLSD